MADARFEIAPYDFARRRAAERRSSASRTRVAQVLARRGLDGPGGRAGVPGRRRPPPAERVRRAARRRRSSSCGHVQAGSRDHRARRLRRGRRRSTAILVRVLRTLGARVDWYLPSRTEDGYGLGAATVERLAARGTQLLLTADCAITAVDEVARGARPRAWTSSSPTTTRRAPTAGCRTRRSCTRALGGGNPCGGPVRGGRRLQARGRAAGGGRATTRRSPTTTSTSSRSRRSPTSSRCTTRTARSCAPGCARCADHAQAGPAGADGRSRASTRAGWTRRRSASASRRASTPPGRIARADAGLELLLTDGRGPRPRRRRGARRAQPASAATSRRGCCFEAEAQVRELGATSPPTCSPARAGTRASIGIVAARIAERRCRPTVLIALDGDEGTGSGPLDPGLRPARPASRPARRHLLRHGGHRAAAGLHDRARRTSTRSARRSRPTPPRCCARRTSCPSSASTRSSPATRSGSASPRSCAARAVRRRQPGRVAARPGRDADRPAAAGGGRAPRRASASSRAARARAPCASARARRCPTSPSTPPSGSRSTPSTAPSSRASCCAARARAPAATIELVGEPATSRPACSAELRRAARCRGRAEPRGGARELRDVRGRGVAGTIADLVATGEPVLVVCAHAAHRARTRCGARRRLRAHVLGALAAAPELAAATRTSSRSTRRALTDAESDARPATGCTHLAWGDA